MGKIYGKEYKEGFVKREHGIGLAQSDVGSKSAEDKSLVIKIDNSTRELIEGLRSIESLAENINKGLLYPSEKPIPNENKTVQAPRGWLEEHLADLRLSTNKVIKIIEKLNRLSFATESKAR